MKLIKIFIASSICEFEAERQLIKAYISSLNDIYISKELYFKLIICENISNAITTERKQDEYNREIQNSDFFYVILGNEVGEYTKEEFTIAYKSFIKNQTPKIYTYFKSLPSGQNPSQSVQDFMSELDTKLGHYYSVFSHIDSIKLNILLELVRYIDSENELKIEDGVLSIHGGAVLSMDSIPIYKNNESVQNLLREMDRLEEEFCALEEMAAFMPDNTVYQRMCMENSEARVQIKEQIHILEKEILGLYRTVSHKRQLGQQINWRERKAITLIDEGNYEAAKNILRDATWKQEVNQAEEMVSLALEPIREFISGQRTLIKTILASDVSEDSLKEVYDCYVMAAGLAERYNIELSILYEFADHLKNYRLGSSEALSVLYRLYNYYLRDPEKNAEEIDSVMFLQSTLLGEEQKRYVESAKIARELLERRRSLAEINPEKYQYSVASYCRNLAGKLKALDKKEEAKELYEEALEIYEKQEAKCSTKGNQYALTSVLEDIGVLMTYMTYKDCCEADKYFQKAMAIYRNLAEDSANAFQEGLARICMNYANALCRMRRSEQARMLYQEALQIQQKRSERLPSVHLRSVADIYNNWALWEERFGNYEDAERMLRKALDIYRIYAEKQPVDYNWTVATVCENLAIVLSRVLKPEEAEPLFRESLKIYKQLAQHISDYYERNVVVSCNNLAICLEGMRRYPEAEDFYKEALELRRSMARENPPKYMPDVIKSLHNLIGVYVKQGRSTEAKELEDEMMRIKAEGAII